MPWFTTFASWLPAVLSAKEHVNESEFCQCTVLVYSECPD